MFTETLSSLNDTTCKTVNATWRHGDMAQDEELQEEDEFDKLYLFPAGSPYLINMSN